MSKTDDATPQNINRDLLHNQLHRILSEISHEAKNTIGTALTASTFLREKSQLILSTFMNGNLSQKELENFLKLSDETMEIITENLTRSADLINNCSHLPYLQKRDNSSTINIFHHLSLVKKTISPRLKKKNVSLTISGDKDIEIPVSPDLLFQIVDNLIINSINHGFKNIQKRGVITINFHQIGENLIVRYHDNGKGIPPEIQPHVFDAYYTTAQESGGVGLGLSIIKSIITDELKGSIRLESDSDSGATFILTIPLLR